MGFVHKLASLPIQQTLFHPFGKVPPPETCPFNPRGYILLWVCIWICSKIILSQLIFMAVTSTHCGKRWNRVAKVWKKLLDLILLWIYGGNICKSVKVQLSVTPKHLDNWTVGAAGGPILLPPLSTALLSQNIIIICTHRNEHVGRTWSMGCSWESLDNVSFTFSHSSFSVVQCTARYRRVKIWSFLLVSVRVDATHRLSSKCLQKHCWHISLDHSSFQHLHCRLMLHLILVLLISTVLVSGA